MVCFFSLRALVLEFLNKIWLIRLMHWNTLNRFPLFCVFFIFYIFWKLLSCSQILSSRTHNHSGLKDTIVLE